MPQNIFGTMINGLTTTGSSSIGGPDSFQSVKSFHGMITGSGLIGMTATINVQGSNLPTSPTLEGHWVTLGTITLSGSTAFSDGFTSEAPWKWYRGTVTAMSGISSTAYLHSGF